MSRKSNEIAPFQVDDLMIVELDDRLEMAVAIVDTNYGCNAKDCSQNVYCPVQ